MTDVAEELSKLAELRDRGVLTPEEFDHQKALILNPPAPVPAPHIDIPPTPVPATAYVAPPPRNNAMLFVIGGLILIAVAGGALWATGVLAKMGIGTAPFGDSSIATSTSSFPMPASSATSVGAATPAAMPTPAAAPSDTAAYPPAATAAGNPVLGQWEGQNNTSTSCPDAVVFTDTQFMMGNKNDQSSQRVGNVTYAVQDANTVVMTGTDSEHTSTTIRVNGSIMLLDGCNYIRSQYQH